MLMKFEIKWSINKPILWEGCENIEAKDARYAEYLAREKVSKRFKIEWGQVKIKSVEETK